MEGWLKKVKSEGAWARRIAPSVWRHFTLSFDSQVLFYAASEMGKSSSRPVPFRDILGAVHLGVPSNDNAEAQGGATPRARCGLLLQTSGRAFELHAATPKEAADWVQALNRAAELGRRWRQPLAFVARESEFESQLLVLKEASSRREAAAASRPDWDDLTWRERLEVLQSLESTSRSSGSSCPASSSSLPEGALQGGARQQALKAVRFISSTSSTTASSTSRENGCLVRSNTAPPILKEDTGSKDSVERPTEESLQEPELTLPTPERIQRIFLASDGLRRLMAGLSRSDLTAAILALRPRRIRAGETLVKQGETGAECFIVDEGCLEAFVGDKDVVQECVCRYGPGSVFGELALSCDELRTSTVVARTETRVWVLDRSVLFTLLPESGSRVGLIGAIALCLNLASAATEVKNAAELTSWQACLGMGLLAAAALLPVCFLQMGSCAAVSVPFMEKLPRPLHALLGCCIVANMLSLLCSLVCQATQAMDLVAAELFQCWPSFSVGIPAVVCATESGSAVSLSLLLVALVVVPFSFLDLSEIVVLQYLGVCGLASAAVVLTFGRPESVNLLSIVIGLLSSCAMLCLLPRVVSYKRPEVLATCGILVVIAAVLSLYWAADGSTHFLRLGTITTELKQISQQLAPGLIQALPVVKSFTLFPLVAILLRDHFVEESQDWAAWMAAGAPFILSMPFVAAQVGTVEVRLLTALPVYIASVAALLQGTR